MINVVEKSQRYATDIETIQEKKMEGKWGINKNTHYFFNNTQRTSLALKKDKEIEVEWNL